MINRLAPLLVAALLLLTATTAWAKPLQVYVLAGQSNMQGHAHVSTIRHLAMSPESKPMYDDMIKDGKPVVLDDVYIVQFEEKRGGDPVKRGGKLTVNYGASNGEKIGPEFTFGIYMHQYLEEPFLIIKTAWGGKSLNTDFRPPSAGPYTPSKGVNMSDEQLQKRQEASGVYYRKMIEHVKEVLAEPGKYHPDYSKADGYEIAGFAWFQGWNDRVDRQTYPRRTQPGGYDLYGELLATFIRDVRKDLDAPNMPFVIGVSGIGGPTSPEIEKQKPKRYQGLTMYLRQGMAAPASMPEFKGNVAAVQTANYWDMQLDELITRSQKKGGPMIKELQKKAEEQKGDRLNHNERMAIRDMVYAEIFTPEEKKILEVGRSNQGFHYHGSAKILGGIGKGFAEAMAELQGLETD